jgi:amylovoran biosynthesis glycosyltransferase AmsB
MKISIVIPTYNASSTIRATIESILSQSVRPDEIIVVDDGSHDITSLRQIIYSFESEIITCIAKEANTNAADSRNIGAQRATGDILCFLDADDHWHSTKLEKQLEKLEPNTLVSCKVRAVVTNSPSELKVKSEFDESLSFCENLFGDLEHNLAFQTSTIMMWREDYLRIGGFDSSLPRHQDYQFIITAEKNGIQLKFVNEVLVDYVKSGRIAKIKHNWSLEKSLYFFDNYLSGQPRFIQENFFIVQLLGPSLQARVLSKWLTAAKSRGLVSFRFILKALGYTLKRVLS